MDLSKNMSDSSSYDEDDVFYSDVDTEQSDDIDEKRVRIDDPKDDLTLLYNPKSFVTSEYNVKKNSYKGSNHKHPNSINNVSRSASGDIDIKDYLLKNKTSSFKRKISSSIRQIRSRSNSEVLINPRIEYDDNFDSLNSHYRKIEELSNKFGTVDLNNNRRRKRSSGFHRGFTSTVSSSSSTGRSGSSSEFNSGKDRFSFVRRSFNRLHTFEHIFNRQENASCTSRLKTNSVSVFHEVPMITLVSYNKARI